MARQLVTSLLRRQDAEIVIHHLVAEKFGNKTRRQANCLPSLILGHGDTGNIRSRLLFSTNGAVN